MFLRKLCCLVVLLVFITQAKATQVHPFNEQIKLKIEENFLNNGIVDNSKLEKYKINIIKRKDEVYNIIKIYKEKYKEKSPKKVKKILKKEKILKYFDIILAYLKKIEETNDQKLKVDIAFKILEIDYALKVEGVHLGSKRKITFIKQSQKSWSIPFVSEYEEASNLFDIIKQEYFTQTELEKKQSLGQDLSLLDPAQNNGFWIKRDIQSADLKTVTSQGQKLFNGITIKFPGENVIFKKIRKTQSKPKLDVYGMIDGVKIKFKLKIGSEMHSEATSSTLFAAIGYTVDPSKYQRNIKMNLGKITPEEFIVEWNSYYSSYDINSYLSSKGKDENGDYYVTFIEGLYEYKPKGVLRVGPWAWGENGIKGNRAARAILVFNMWVSNLDLKEAENNKLIIRENGSGDFDFYHLQHDMGFAFGKVYREKPGSYEWDLVSKVTQSKIHFNFSNFQKNSGFKHVTYSDGKWMTRLIAGLSRKQIEDAVALGGWPKGIDKLLTEKLIARRNQLVDAFGLKNEYPILDFDRYLTTKNGVVIKGKLIISEFDDYTQDFGNEFSEVIKPVTEGLRNFLIDQIATVTKKTDSFDIDPAEFGLDSAIISKIIFGVDRTINRNPYPTSDKDQYLVKDHMTLGFRLGFGYVLAGDVRYVREYTLVQAVSSPNHARFKNSFIVNLLLPLQSKFEQLPESSVLIKEQYFEARGRVRFLDTLNIPLGFDISDSIVKLKRTFLSRKKSKKVIYFEDSGYYTKFASKLYWELGIFNIPIFKSKLKKGVIKRKYYELDMNTPNYNYIIDRAIVFNDTALLKKKGVSRKIKDNFRAKSMYIRLANFWQFKKKRRVDNIVEKEFDEFGNETGRNYVFQIENNKKYEWQFLDNGEQYKSKVSFISEVKDENRLSDKKIIDIQLRINDKSTKTKELNKYIRTINTIAGGDDKFIEFTPEIHTKNDLWGNVLVDINFSINENGIEDILSIGSFDELKNHMKSIKYISGKISNMKQKLKKLYKAIVKAKKQVSDKKKIKILTSAINKLIKKKNGTYLGASLAVLRSIITTQNLFLSALITLPEDKEMKFPARSPLYSEMGDKNIIKSSALFDYYLFSFSHSEDIYFYRN